MSQMGTDKNKFFFGLKFSHLDNKKFTPNRIKIKIKTNP